MTRERENDGDCFARLPATDAERDIEGRATRAATLAWWEERFGVDPATSSFAQKNPPVSARWGQTRRAFRTLAS